MSKYFLLKYLLKVFKSNFFNYIKMDLNPIVEKKKRGRKSKKELEMIKNEIANKVSEEPENEIKLIKKRGRKPRGGKLFPKINDNNSNNNEVNNIILHLKCSLNDIYANNYDENIEHYHFNENKISDLNYELINKKPTSNSIDNSINNSVNNTSSISDTDKANHENNKTIHEKIEALSYNLHTNNVCDKKSSCFWCTFDFDNNPIYIPKHELNNSYNVYGCFCSPECACAYLMNDKDIDNASRFERYQLLNNIYCKIYNYTKNIKPAPNPYYTLDKYYGNLTIQEYRKMLKNERLLLIVDKPLTRILPELYDENNDNNYLNKGLQTNSIMRKNIAVSKINIVSENFNIK